LDDANVLVMHLGMSGSFRIGTREGADKPGNFHHPRSQAGLHDHIVFEMSSGARITYNDPRRFGFMLIIPRAELDAHPLFAGMGIEPLGNELDGALLASLFARKSTPLKAVLLDQRLIAGLGNIYVCEALHRAGLSPRRAAGTLARRNGAPTDKAHRLAEVIPQVLNEAVAAGGSSLRDHRQTDGTLGYFQHRFRVYDREGEPCPTPGCAGTIRRMVQSGRSTFFCPVCQR
jgi:formamidopyrimidine-DNA glycosylase